MRPVAFIRQMLAAGVDLDTALMAAEKFEDQAEQERQATMADLLDRLARDVKAERRLEKDRLRKANGGNPRKSAESEEIAETLSEGSQGSLSPEPPNLPNLPNLSQEPPISPKIRVSKARLGPPKGAFARFWAEYPWRVGRRKAEIAYGHAWGRCESDDPEAEILGGLRGCAPLWAPEFIPHPTTWLNRDGWLDQPKPDLPDSTGPPRLDIAKIDADRARIRAMYETEDTAA